MERIRGMATIAALFIGLLMIGLCLGSTTAMAADHEVVDVEASESGVHMEHLVLVDDMGVIRSQAPFRTVTFTYNPRIVATIAISTVADVSKRTEVIRSQAPMNLAYGTKFVQYKHRSNQRTTSPRTKEQREHVATLERWADEMRDTYGPSVE